MPFSAVLTPEKPSSIVSKPAGTLIMPAALGRFCGDSR
jgi:hypothetical protein